MENNINEDHQSDEEVKTCRICLSSDESPIISPCKCKGSYKFVHEECLKMWIESRNSDYFNSVCEICNHQYYVTAEKIIIYDPKKAREENFGYCCAIPILSFFIFVLCIILILVCIFRLDFNNEKTYSYIVVGIILFPIVSGISVMPLLIYKIIFKSGVKNLKILDYKD